VTSHGRGSLVNSTRPASPPGERVCNMWHGGCRSIGHVVGKQRRFRSILCAPFAETTNLRGVEGLENEPPLERDSKRRCSLSPRIGDPSRPELNRPCKGPCKNHHPPPIARLKERNGDSDSTDARTVASCGVIEESSREMRHFSSRVSPPNGGDAEEGVPAK